MSDAADCAADDNGGSKRPHEDAEPAIAADGASTVVATTREEGEPPRKVAKLESGDQFADAEEVDCGTPPSDPPPGEAEIEALNIDGGVTNPEAPVPETHAHQNAAESTVDPASAPSPSDAAETDPPPSAEVASTEEEAHSNPDGNPGGAPPPEATTGASHLPAEDASNLFMVDRAGTDPSEVVQLAVPLSNPGPPSHPTGGNPSSSTPHYPAASGLPPGVFPAQATTNPPTPAPGDQPVHQPTLASPGQQQVEEREEISAQVVGKIIGKGGEMIKDLQTRSGARIDVDQNVPSGLPRVVTYRGTRESVDMARSLVRMLTVEGVSETDLPLGLASREILAVPAQSVGKIIGRGGELIRVLQAKSGAKIQVDHHGSTASGIPPDQKKVTIIGTEQSVVKAKEMVMFLVSNPMMDAMQALTMLIEDKLRGNAWGTGHPYPSMPNQGYNMTPEMVAPGAIGGGGGYPAYQQSAYGGPPTMGAYGMPAPMPAEPYQSAGYGLYNAAPLATGAANAEVDVTYVQRQYTGRIIGSKGITINDLQRRSGTDIQVNQQQVPNSSETEITIRGSRQGIEMAKHMIREIIEAGPGHPYAGGADSGYGAGGQYGGGGGYGRHLQQQAPGYDYGQAYGGYAQLQPAYGQAPPQQAAYAPQPQVAQPYSAAYGGGGGYGQQSLPPQQGGAYGAAAVPTAGGYSYGAQAAAVPAPQPQATPWKAATTPDGQVYYYNEQTGETQWEKPAGL